MTQTTFAPALESVPAEVRPARAVDTDRRDSRLELVIAILLGIVSIVVAYASFQAALYDSKMAGDYQRGSALSTEAESLYLEANQQYTQDTQLWNRLTELAIESESADPAIAANAQSTYEIIAFQSVSDDLSAAIDWADAENAANPDVYISPLDSEDYQATLYGPYGETKEQAEQAVTDGNAANSWSDQLTLYTVLMAVSLFLLGIAAVVRGFRTRVVLVITGAGIFAVSLVLVLTVPYIAL